MAIKSNQLLGNLIERRDQLGLTLSPSWLSGLAAVTISMLIIFGAIASLNYGGSSLHLELESNKTETRAATAGTYEYNDIDDKFSANALVSSIPLFIFWAAVGLVAYSFTMSIINSLRKVVDLEQEMNYIHA